MTPQTLIAFTMFVAAFIIAATVTILEARLPDNQPAPAWMAPVSAVGFLLAGAAVLVAVAGGHA